MTHDPLPSAVARKQPLSDTPTTAMRSVALHLLTAIVSGSLVYFLHEPQAKIVEVERIRTIAAPPAPQLPSLKGTDEKLGTQVNLNRATMKRMTIGTWYKGKFSKDIQEFLKMTPEETEKCALIVNATIDKMKEYESKHLRLVTDENDSETLVIDSFWESGGKELYEGMQDQFTDVLGEGRAGVLAMGIGQSSLNVGNFGYFQTHLYIEDGTQPDGSSIPMVHIYQEAPFGGGLRKLIVQEKDPVKREQLARLRGLGRGKELESLFGVKTGHAVSTTEARYWLVWGGYFGAEIFGGGWSGRQSLS